MPKLLKKFDDPRLSRKIAVLRIISFLLSIAWTAFVLSQSIRGEMVATASSNGLSRSISRTYLRTITWDEQPIMFALNLAWLVGIGVLFITGYHIVLAGFIEKRHGRPFFKRKYPY